MAVEITVNPIPAEKILEMIRKFGKQLPFAESLAINNTAKIVQKEEIENIESKFRNRKAWFRKGKFSVKIRFSNKRSLFSSIFSQAPWLDLQERGGIKKQKTKTPLTNKKLLLMPVREIRQTKTRLTPKRLSPAKLLKNPKKNRVFFVENQKTALILQRFGKKKNSKTRVLFFAEDRAKIPPILEFEKLGERVVNKNYRKQFGKALGFAIATAKGKITKDTG